MAFFFASVVFSVPYFIHVKHSYPHIFKVSVALSHTGVSDCCRTSLTAVLKVEALACTPELKQLCFFFFFFNQTKERNTQRESTDLMLQGWNYFD